MELFDSINLGAIASTQKRNAAQFLELDSEIQLGGGAFLGTRQGTSWGTREFRASRNRLVLLCYLFLKNLGGAEGIRTPDLCSAIAALSHLSYSPKALAF